MLTDVCIWCADDGSTGTPDDTLMASFQRQRWNIKRTSDKADKKNKQSKNHCNHSRKLSKD